MEKTVAAQDLQVKIVEIKGRCPVYAIGDGFRILGGWKLQAQRPICLHALSSLMPYYVALSRGIPPSDLGLGDAETSRPCSASTPASGPVVGRSSSPFRG